jgi:hypothetical protein
MLPLLGSLALLGCAPEPHAQALQEPAYEVPAINGEAKLSPEPVIERPDDRPEILSWLRCHPSRTARFEFAEGDGRANSPADRAEIRRLVTDWNSQPQDLDRTVKVLIIGGQSANESMAIHELRAEGIRDALVEAGADPAMLLAAGFDLPIQYDDEDAVQQVEVLEVCEVCCLL